MRLYGIVILLIVSVFMLSGWIVQSPKPTRITFNIPQGWPKPFYPFKKNKLTQEGFELGKKLFYDVRLSQDGLVSCNSCHQQFAAFSTFEHPLSHGVNNQFSSRNAPALQNLAWLPYYMQDGSISSLDAQPIHPLTNPKEMGETMPHVLEKIKADTSYQRLYKAAFGKNTIDSQYTLLALSQYLLQLVSYNSKYDKVMRGEASFILPERLGYAIFKQKCSSCHQEPLFTDNSFRNIGMPKDKFLKDVGRMEVTKLSIDSLKFRVPSLRNVMVTAPYGHDGRFFSLYQVFQHYSNKMVVIPQTDSLLQHKLPLSNYEIGQLTAFLYTLTDSSFISNATLSVAEYSKGAFKDSH